MFAITMTGDLFAWGAEMGPRSGLGGGATPRRLPLNAVVDVAVSWDETCALEQSGQISCWHASAAPKVLASLPSAKSLALSRRQTCALLDSGRVTCFGEQQAASEPAAVTDAVELAAAGDTHCALRRQGALQCWPDSVLVRSFAEAAGHDVRHLSGTPHALCAFQATGVPQCLTVASGGDRDEPVFQPTHVFPGATDVTDVRFGPSHACALTKGVSWCWGKNEFDVLGQPHAPEGVLLARVSLGDTAALRHATRVAAGKYHRCVVGSDGKLRCWGDGAWGQLGTPHETAHAGPTLVPDLSDVTDVVVNDTTTCALLSDRSLHCFGSQPWREDLGGCEAADDSEEHRSHCSSTPTLTATSVAQAGLGKDYICTLGTNARVHCWGTNDRGQLGTGDTKNRTTPTLVLTQTGRELGRVSKLRVFENHACAVMASGAIACWGDNAPLTQGRPYNSEPFVTFATPLLGVAGMQDVSDHCILSRSGELRCWGNVFPDTSNFSYEPLRIGRCGVSEVSPGLGPCYSDASGANCLGVGYGGFHTSVVLRSLAGSATTLCGVDSRGSLACWNTELNNVRPLIGTAAAVDLPWPPAQRGCALDPIPTVPKFPPIPPASVTAHDLQRGAASADNGVRLSKQQVANLLDLLNDPRNYTRSRTCHDTRHEYVFRDAEGRSRATLGVSNDCLTIDADPEIPAQRRGGGGNIVGAKLKRGLAALCLALRLDGCPDGSSPVADPSQRGPEKTE